MRCQAVTFLLFMIASNSAFSLLNCTIMADGSYHLVGDLDVVCYEGEHLGPYITGIVFVFLYPVGVPVALLLALKRAQCKGALYQLGEDGKPTTDALGDVQPAEAMAPIAAMYARYDPLACGRRSAQMLQMLHSRSEADTLHMSADALLSATSTVRSPATPI